MQCIWTHVNTHMSTMALSRNFNQEYINITISITFILYLLLLLHISNIVYVKLMYWHYDNKSNVRQTHQLYLLCEIGYMFRSLQDHLQAFNWIKSLKFNWRPDDDPIRIETCSQSHIINKVDVFDVHWFVIILLLTYQDVYFQKSIGILYSFVLMSTWA